VRTVVLGIGNVLLRDEGVGVHVARALAEHGCPTHIRVLEVGTAFLDALAEIEQAERILIVDAMKADGTPGTIYRVPFEDCVRPELIASMHGFDLSRVLFLAGRTSSPPEVIVIGVEPAVIDWGTELSPEVAVAVPAVLAAIGAEAELHLAPRMASSRP
jgi:hydrogenase maturation protease